MFAASQLLEDYLTSDSDMERHPFTRYSAAAALQHGLGPLLPCDEALLEAFEQDDAFQATAVRSLVNTYPHWYKTDIWWFPFEKHEHEEHEYVPLLAMAARHCSVELFAWISTFVTSKRFLKRELSLVSPLREAVAAQNTILKWLHLQLGNGSFMATQSFFIFNAY